MFGAAVCDDSPQMLEQMERILASYEKVPVKVSVFQSGEALLESGETFDILFLDIDMEGLDGIETARRLREIDRRVKIIYLTNYPDYSMLAISVHAFAYLLKSDNREALENQVYAQLDEALQYLEMELEERLEFTSAEGRVQVRVSDIFYFEYENRAVKMVTPDGVYRLKRKITELAREMERYHFAAPHKSFVVNLYRVKAIKGNDVIMADGTPIPLSQKRAADMRRTMNRYLGQLTGRRNA